MNRGDFSLSGIGSGGQLDPAGGGPGAIAPGPSPSLSICNNSALADDKGHSEAGASDLPGPRKKQAEALYRNLVFMVEQFGLNCLGFLTLTVGDMVGGRFVQVHDRKEAEKRFNRLARRFLKRYRCWVVATERHLSGAIHFHLVVAMAGPASAEALPVDIRTGFDFELFLACRAAGRRFTAQQVGACPALAAEWAALREGLARFGFGRAELTPVRTNAEGMGRYMGKYLSKDWSARRPEDKGARCIRYGGHWSRKAQKGVRRARPCMAVFGWATPRARAWRVFLAQMAVVLEVRDQIKLTPENIAEKWGKRWAFRFKQAAVKTLFIPEDNLPLAVRGAVDMHNLEVSFACRRAFRSARLITAARVSDFLKPEDWREVEEFDSLQNETERRLYDYCHREKSDREMPARWLSEVASKFDNEPF